MDSLLKGVYNQESFKEYEKRRMTSIGVCVIGWLLEVFTVIVTGLGMLLKKFGVLYFYPFGDFFVVSSRFIIIPFIHLLNDEDTKTVITTENWIMGIRHALGYYKQPNL